MLGASLRSFPEALFRSPRRKTIRWRHANRGLRQSFVMTSEKKDIPRAYCAFLNPQICVLELRRRPQKPHSKFPGRLRTKQLTPPRTPLFLRPLLVHEGVWFQPLKSLDSRDMGQACCATIIAPTADRNMLSSSRRSHSPEVILLSVAVG